MAFAIFKVVDMAGGKITAKLVNNIQGLPIELKRNDILNGNNLTRNYKFTFIKSSDFSIESKDTGASTTTAKIEFKYKDNF